MTGAPKTPDYRETRKWVQAGGPLYDWPMFDTCCANCHTAARRCRLESEAIVEKAEAEGRDLTETERESIAIFAEGYRVLGQADAVMYPNPVQGPNAPKIDDALEWNRAMARGSSICPRCSTPAAEAKLRQECIDAGFGILPDGLFVTAPANQDGVKFRLKGPGARDEQLELSA